MSFELLVTLLLTAALLVIMLRFGHGPRFFQFPFLFSAVWVGFILLGMIEFIISGDALYKIYVQNGTVSVALFLMISSATCGLVGYALAGGSRRTLTVGGRPVMSLKRRPLTVAEMKRMNLISFVIAGLSVSAFILLASLGGGLQAYIFASGNYTITFEGLPVYLVFVIRFIYVSIAIQLWIWTRTSQNVHFILAVAFSIIPFINIVFIFRRSELLTIGVLYGYFFSTYAKIAISRLSAILSILIMVIVMKIFPLFRAGVDSVNWSDVYNAIFRIRDNFENSEIGSGMYRIYVTMSTSNFEYGAIFWNAFINQFVPAGIVGRDFKNSLVIPTQETFDLSFAAFKFYLSPMGFAQAFTQFWYFGPLLFALIGWTVAKMEQNRFNSARAEILLVLLIPALLSTVSADMSLIVSRAITYGALVMLCVPHQPRLSVRQKRRRETLFGSGMLPRGAPSDALGRTGLLNTSERLAGR
jgi:hypothetical protein